MKTDTVEGGWWKRDKTRHTIHWALERKIYTQSIGISKENIHTIHWNIERKNTHNPLEYRKKIYTQSIGLVEKVQKIVLKLDLSRNFANDALDPNVLSLVPSHILFCSGLSDC